MKTYISLFSLIIFSFFAIYSQERYTYFFTPKGITYKLTPADFKDIEQLSDPVAESYFAKLRSGSSVGCARFDTGPNAGKTYCNIITGAYESKIDPENFNIMRQTYENRESKK